MLIVCRPGYYLDAGVHCIRKECQGYGARSSDRNCVIDRPRRGIHIDTDSDCKSTSVMSMSTVVLWKLRFSSFGKLRHTEDNGHESTLTRRTYASWFFVRFPRLADRICLCDKIRSWADSRIHLQVEHSRARSNTDQSVKVRSTKSKTSQVSTKGSA